MRHQKKNAANPVRRTPDRILGHRAERKIVNRENGKGEADSGLRPDRKGGGIRQANIDSEAPFFFSGKRATNVTHRRIRTATIEVCLIAPHTFNCAYASFILAEEAEADIVGGRKKAAIDAGQGCETKANGSHISLLYRGSEISSRYIRRVCNSGSVPRRATGRQGSKHDADGRS